MESIDGKTTGRIFHALIDPEREIDAGAYRVHGISRSQLIGKPRFAEIADAFADFVRGAECLMHNAAFDTSFLDSEFERAGHDFRIHHAGRVTCTVALARRVFPGQKAGLDELILRAGLTTTRGRHSALEDASLLANVYHRILGTKPYGGAARSPVASNLTTQKNDAPRLMPHLASVAEHYLTLHRVDPVRTYNYIARELRDQPVIECTRHLPKCAQGESWLYVAIPEGSQLRDLDPQDRLYVGSQTQDRMFRGDGMSGNNFHHAEMRTGNGSDNLLSFLRSGNQARVYRFSASRIHEVVSACSELQALSPLTKQAEGNRKHPAWWFEQYLLHSERGMWRWNSAPATKLIADVLTTRQVNAACSAAGDASLCWTRPIRS